MQSQFSTEDAARFWSKLVGPVWPTACWEWRGARSRKGYGTVYHKGRWHVAHRIAWEVSFGSIPESLWVLHACDNRLCCNPSHLRLGDPKENSEDMCRKGRCRSRKLTAIEVKGIRYLARHHVNGKKLAKIYDVSDVAVYKILNGKSWAWLPDEENENG